MSDSDSPVRARLEPRSNLSAFNRGVRLEPEPGAGGTRSGAQPGRKCPGKDFRSAGKDFRSAVNDCPEKADQIDPNGPEKAMKDVRRIPRAVELINSGIKFEPCDGVVKSIKFEPKSATIRLPRINITNHTEVLFRNLIALEACKPSEINYVTRYLSLLDELIDSEEDVTLLRKSSVVTNYLGSDAEVAELFNGLCKGVTLSMIDVFEQLKREVDFQYRRKFKVYRTYVEHFSSPWRSLALAGAIVGLSLTVVQTVYSIP